MQELKSTCATIKELLVYLQLLYSLWLPGCVTSSCALKQDIPLGFGFLIRKMDLTRAYSSNVMRGK